MAYATEENLTELAVERWQRVKSPRLRQIMTSLVRHLHGFIREVELTEEEWLAAVQFLARTGQLCDDKRQEFILLSDVLGASMLVDAINHRLPSEATPSTVLGPFHIEGSPELDMGGDMTAGAEGSTCYMTGTVRDLDGAPIEGAVLDLWQADGAGVYEAQLPDCDGPRLRALYRTGPDGAYCVRTIVPLGYAIPLDGPVGELINKETEISPCRPPHIHFMVSAPGYQRLVTHLFQQGGDYIDSDVVFGVKEPLITEFQRRPPGRTPAGDESSEPFYLVEYDFTLPRAA